MEGTIPVCTLSQDPQPPGLGENTFLLVESPVCSSGPRTLSRAIGPSPCRWRTSSSSFSWQDSNKNRTTSCHAYKAEGWQPRESDCNPGYTFGAEREEGEGARLGVPISLAHAAILVCLRDPHSWGRPASSRSRRGAAPSLRAFPACLGPGCAPAMDGALTQGFQGPVGLSSTLLCSLVPSASPASDTAVCCLQRRSQDS